MSRTVARQHLYSEERQAAQGGAKLHGTVSLFRFNIIQQHLSIVINFIRHLPIVFSDILHMYVYVHLFNQKKTFLPSDLLLSGEISSDKIRSMPNLRDCDSTIFVLL